MKTYIAAALVAATFGATAAQAEAPNGFRVEALIGWDNHDISSDDLDGFGVDLGSDGVAFGIAAGYDFAVGSNVALGIDVEASETTAEFELSEAGQTVSLDYGRDLYIGGRVTVAASSKLNLYAKAGYTNGRVEFDTNVPGAGITDLAGELDGFRLGAGLQYAVSEKVYLGGEYRYSNYDGPFTRNQLVATLGFRF